MAYNSQDSNAHSGYCFLEYCSNLPSCLQMINHESTCLGVGLQSQILPTE